MCKRSIIRDVEQFCSSSSGITNTIGRILSGFLANLKNVNALVINNVALVIASVALALQPFCTVYPALVVFCVVFGLCCGEYYSNENMKYELKKIKNRMLHHFNIKFRSHRVHLILDMFIIGMYYVYRINTYRCKLSND